MDLIQFATGGGTMVLISFASELFSWISKKLNGTPLQGASAWLTTLLLSFIGGAIYLFYEFSTGVSFANLAAMMAVMMVGAEFVFNLVIKNVPSLHVQ